MLPLLPCVEKFVLAFDFMSCHRARQCGIHDREQIAPVTCLRQTEEVGRVSENGK
jgi:hypothetical protein